MTVMAFKAITPHDFGQQLPGSRALPLSHERYDSASVVVRTQEPTRKRQSDDCLPGLLHVGLKGPRSPVQVRPWRSQTARIEYLNGLSLRTDNREPIPRTGEAGCYLPRRDPAITPTYGRHSRGPTLRSVDHHEQDWNIGRRRRRHRAGYLGLLGYDGLRSLP